MSHDPRQEFDLINPQVLRRFAEQKGIELPANASDRQVREELEKAAGGELADLRRWVTRLEVEQLVKQLDLKVAKAVEEKAKDLAGKIEGAMSAIEVTQKYSSVLNYSYTALAGIISLVLIVATIFGMGQSSSINDKIHKYDTEALAIIRETHEKMQQFDDKVQARTGDIDTKVAEVEKLKEGLDRTNREHQKSLNDLAWENERLKKFNGAFRKVFTVHLMDDCKSFLEEFSVSRPHAESFKRIRDNQDAIIDLGLDRAGGGKDGDSAILSWVGKVNGCIVELGQASEDILTLTPGEHKEKARKLLEVAGHWKSLEDELETEIKARRAGSVQDESYGRFLTKELGSYIKNVESIIQIALYRLEKEPPFLARAKQFAEGARDTNPRYSRAYSNLAIIEGFDFEARLEANGKGQTERDFEPLIADYDAKKPVILEYLGKAQVLADTSRAKSIALNNFADAFLFEAMLLGGHLDLVSRSSREGIKADHPEVRRVRLAIETARKFISDAKRLANTPPVIYLTEAQLLCQELCLERTLSPKADPARWKSPPVDVERKFAEIESLIDLAMHFEYGEYRAYKDLDNFLEEQPFGVLSDLAKGTVLEKSYRERLVASLRIWKP